MVTSLRIFVLGGLTSYRALFTWLSPWILIPTFVVEPVFQVIFFAFVGREARINDDRFFLIGNAVQFAAIPCLFAMSNTIGGERYSQTLELLLASPARRGPLFLGRALPVIVNGFGSSVIALVVGAAALRVALPPGTWLPLAAIIAVSAFACTGLGLLTAAVALRVRETAVLANIVFGVLLVFCGTNVALTALPGWMATVGRWLPLTHGIEAARQVAGGDPLSAVAGLVGREAVVGMIYVAIGMALLRFFEAESRRRATLLIA
jgi:ABC-2 type transport system permease protein